MCDELVRFRIYNIMAVDVADNDSDEQHKGDAERNPTKLNLTKFHAQTDDQRVDDHEVGYGTGILNDVS